MQCDKCHKPRAHLCAASVNGGRLSGRLHQRRVRDALGRCGTMSGRCFGRCLRGGDGAGSTVVRKEGDGAGPRSYPLDWLQSLEVEQLGQPWTALWGA